MGNELLILGFLGEKFGRNSENSGSFREKMVERAISFLSYRQAVPDLSRG